MPYAPWCVTRRERVYSFHVIGTQQSLSIEFLENFEEMFPRYYMHSDIYNRLTSLTTHYYVSIKKGKTIIYWK